MMKFQVTIFSMGVVAVGMLYVNIVVGSVEFIEIYKVHEINEFGCRSSWLNEWFFYMIFTLSISFLTLYFVLQFGRNRPWR